MPPMIASFNQLFSTVCVGLLLLLVHIPGNMQLARAFKPQAPLHGWSRRTNSLASLLFMSTGSSGSSGTGMQSKAQESEKNSTPAKMPITIISGFLGAGKTTFLQHVLKNADGAKCGLVVNDMATVNVDSKLIKQQTMSGVFGGVDTVELQNGCVCCTLADDLLASVTKLVSLSHLRQSRYDHIIVECSGIAEPRKIRELFQDAQDYGSPMVYDIQLDTLVTLVDAAVFVDVFGSDKELRSQSTLAFKKGDPDGQKMLDEGAGQRKVTELLLEQVECADVVIINKCDLLKRPEDIELVRGVIAKINPTAKVLTCSNGQVLDPLKVVGSARGEGAASWGILDEHRKVIAAIEEEKLQQEQNKQAVAAKGDHNHDQGHGHEHYHDHAVTKSCHDPSCKDPSHKHDHDHQHHTSVSDGSSCAPDCNDPTHNHSSHSHDHDHADCTPDCNDPTHNHDHSHSHSHGNGHAECTPDCNDPTHNHDHSHSHDHKQSDETTAQQRFGITSFVYKRRKPFHPIRLSQFLQSLGKLSVKGVTDIAASSPDAAANPSVHRSLLRSKGFMWMATSSAGAYFLSHAGQYLEVLVMGRWWDDIPREEWPTGLADEIMMDFDAKSANGDRRQELVFIGQFDGGRNTQEGLEQLLDACLLTDKEMQAYEANKARGDEKLRSIFLAPQ